MDITPKGGKAGHWSLDNATIAPLPELSKTGPAFIVSVSQLSGGGGSFSPPSPQKMRLVSGARKKVLEAVFMPGLPGRWLGERRKLEKMSCNRVVVDSASMAAGLGVEKTNLEAAWAASRHASRQKKGGPHLCPVCRNCFLREDGGCSKCEQGLGQDARRNPERYAAGFLGEKYPVEAMKAIAPAMVELENAKLRRVAIPYLEDPMTLDELAQEEDPFIQAGVAANPNASPGALAYLVGHDEREVYRAAAHNPQLALSALRQAEREAKEAWQQALREMAQNLVKLSSQKKRSGLMSLLSLGVLGSSLMAPYQRYSTLRRALQQRLYRDEIRAQEKKSESTAFKPTASPQPANKDKDDAQTLTQKEQNLINDGLEIVDTYLAETPDYFGEGVTVDDVERTKREGVQTDQDRQLVGNILDEMAEAEQRFPGWFDATPQEFAQLKEKIRSSGET